MGVLLCAVALRHESKTQKTELLFKGRWRLYFLLVVLMRAIAVESPAAFVTIDGDEEAGTAVEALGAYAASTR